jgi:hypothetical protein
MFRYLGLLVLAATSFVFSQASAEEYRLQFSYSLDCTELTAKGFPGVTGTYEIGSKKFRVHLYKYNTTQSIGVSTDAPITADEIQLTWKQDTGCSIVQVKQTLTDLSTLTGRSSFQALAQAHSPVLKSRIDQETNLERDVPLTLAYTILKNASGNFKIRYTMFFSNETVKGFLATSKVKSLVQWGRRTDIEWIYEVEFDAAGNVVSKRYQGGIIGGFGHKARDFNGEFVAGSSHPVLYDIAKHNVFSDRGKNSAAVQFLAETEISQLSAREEWMLAHPWTFDVSDRELSRNHELHTASDGFLYVLVKGGNRKGLKLALGTASGSSRTSKLKSLLNNLGGNAAFTAIELSDADFAAGGTLTLTPDITPTRFSNLSFYRLASDLSEGFTLVDVTGHVHCDENLVCHF